MKVIKFKESFSLTLRHCSILLLRLFNLHGRSEPAPQRFLLSLVCLLLVIFADKSYGGTMEYVTHPDGSVSFFSSFFLIAFGPHKTAIAWAMMIIGALVCVASMTKSFGRIGNARSARARARIHLTVRKFVSIKSDLAPETIGMLIGALLTILGAFLNVIERIYGATV